MGSPAPTVAGARSRPVNDAFRTAGRPEPMSTKHRPAPTRPAKQGLYDPQFEHDACGVGFVVNIKGRKSHQHPRAGHPGPEEPRPPRRLRLRGQHRRRRRRADPDAARLQRGGVPQGAHPAAGGRRVRQRHHLPAAQPDGTPPGRAEVRAGRAVRGPARDRLAHGADRERHARRDGTLLRAVHAPGVHRARPVDRGRARLRAQALRDPQARLQRDPHLDAAGRRVLVRGQPVVPHVRLQGHAAHDAARPVLPRPAQPGRSRPRWRWCTRASAPTRSRAGTARTRTATSPTTARSTRCAATSTGCTPARRASRPSCSARTSRKICPIINPNGSDSGMFDNTLELL